MQRIIYPSETGISIIIPADCGLTVEQIAVKDVPVGVPFLIVDTATIPADRTYRGAWAAEFSTPDGYGGAK